MTENGNIAVTLSRAFLEARCHQEPSLKIWYTHTYSALSFRNPASVPFGWTEGSVGA